MISIFCNLMNVKFGAWGTGLAALLGVGAIFLAALDKKRTDGIIFQDQFAALWSSPLLSSPERRRRAAKRQCTFIF